MAATTPSAQIASSIPLSKYASRQVLFFSCSDQQPPSEIRIKASVFSAPRGGRKLTMKASVMDEVHQPSRDCPPLPLPKPLSATELPDSVNHRSQLRVAYQGVPGAYSEAAAGKVYPNCEPVPCEQFETAFAAVERWLVDRAVLPIENSLGGSIHRNYDLLLRHHLHIVGEVQFAVRHCLLASPGVKLEALKRVLSHPQALAQCELTLSKLGVAREAVDDTAGAAQYVANHNLQDTGAVASARAAEIYGLNVLAEDIQDCSDNVTRFLMLAREPVVPGVDKPFKIESRPWKQQPFRISDDCNSTSQRYFNYLFYVDFEASMAEKRAQNALRNLEEFATFLRLLGSYPMDVNGFGQ